jgi:hypothetical protein
VPTGRLGGIDNRHSVGYLWGAGYVRSATM